MIKISRLTVNESRVHMLFKRSTVRKKSQFETRFIPIKQGFLLIECLLALLTISFLVLLLSLGQKKCIEGSSMLRVRLKGIQHASNTLHSLMLEPDLVSRQTIKKDDFDVILNDEDIRLSISDQSLSWLFKETIPVKGISVTITWPKTGNIKHTMSFYTALIKDV